MNLIGPLTSGINGAEGGSVAVTLRGTAQPTTIYRTFEGTDPDETGVATLDVNGSVELYVDTTCTVTVRDSQGNTIREFVAAASAPAVEVRSESFSGQNYDDGSGVKAPGMGQPTTLQAVLDLWRSVNGGSDWRVGDNDGTEFSMQDLVVALLHQGIDVTAPQYGALGDGVSDDLPAFVAADAAATAQGGGIILVPASPNFYRWSDKFTLGTLNSMRGVGSNSSIIRLDASSPATGMIDVPFATNTGQVGKHIQRLAFEGEPSSYLMNVTSPLELRGCRLKNLGVSHRVLLVQNSGDDDEKTFLRAEDCVFELDGMLSSVLGDDGASGSAHSVFERCTFTTPQTQYQGIMFIAKNLQVSHCTFGFPQFVSNVGQTFYIFEPLLSGFLTVSFNDIFVGGGDSSGNGVLFRNTNPNVFVNEYGNRINVSTHFEFNGASMKRYSTLTTSRWDTNVSGTNFSSGSPAEIESSRYVHAVLTRTSSNDFAFDLEDGTGYEGSWMTVAITNDAGIDINNVTLGANIFGDNSGEGIDDGQTRTWLFRSTGGGTWSQIGPSLVFP